jgi:hypothetical protein
MLTARRSSLAAGIILSLTVFLMSVAWAEIPNKINYQGRITDVDTGEAMPGPHDMVFRIYDVPDGGTEVWSEFGTVPVDSAGVFSVILGAVTPIELAFDGPVWLEVEVAGEVLSPRREIVSVPFAFYAKRAGHTANADSLGGYGAGDFIRVGETAVITAEMIVDGTGSGLDADKVDGLDAEAFADTGHTHDHRYVHRDSLGTAGAVNNGSNPVDWTRLKGVPGGLADGVDDVGGAGDGHSLDAADGDPVDAVYVDNEGYVGLGTSSPTERLHLTGPTSRILVEAGTSNPEIGLAGLFYPASDVWRIYVNKGLGTLCFARGGDRMTIGGVNGNVAIGAPLGGERLHVDGNINLSGKLKIDWYPVLSVDGTANTLVGTNAGFNTTGSSNTFVGTSAGYFNGLGFGNVFVGDSSGYANTDGDLNVFVGSSAGYSNTIGGSNTFVGKAAGESNDDGGSNTFIGAAAGFKTTDGDYNTFVGEGAGAFNEGGENNTYLGQGAGSWNDSGDRNTFLGAWAGGTNHGDGSVFLGYRAGVNEPGSDKLYIANGPDDSDALIYGDFSTGRVGLGTLDPATRLHISSPTSNFGMLRVENSNTGNNEASIGFKPGSDATGADMWVAGVGSWGETGDFVIGKAEPKVVITPDGRVGIGETNPFNPLEVKRGSTCWIRSEADGGLGIAGLALANDTGSWAIDLRGDMSDALTFMYGSEFQFHFAIDTEGRVGIGTVTPDQKLHLKGANPRVLIEASSVDPEVNFKHSGDASSDVWAIYKHGATEDLRFYQNGDKIWIKGGTGNVGIGTASPGVYKLYVNGCAGGTGAWNICSDLRFKRDIQDVTGAIDKVMSLRGVSFLWRSDEYEDKNFDTGRHYGVVAQEIEEVLPEVVIEVADGEKAVAYTEIVPVLIEAIKAQQQQISILEQRIAELEDGSGGLR